MKKKQGVFWGTLLAATLLLLVAGCDSEISDGNGDSDTNMVFLSAVQTGGASGTADSTAVTLTFDIDPDSLTADDITVTGATKGTLTGSGTTRTLNISNITVADSETISVTITSPAGFTISGSPKTVTVYKLLSVGMNYKGGKIVYILDPDDSGFSWTQAHGIIAATADQSNGIVWISGGNTQTTATGGTGGGIREGYDNTNTIIAQAETAGNMDRSTYAAGLCNQFTNIDTGTGVFSDWYLPSRDVLSKLYLNKVAIGGFSNATYWSSSENGDDPPLINITNFADGNGSFALKNTSHRVRAVRDF